MFEIPTHGILAVVSGYRDFIFIFLYYYIPIYAKEKKRLQLFKMQVRCGLSYLNFSGLASFESVHFPSAIFRLHF